MAALQSPWLAQFSLAAPRPCGPRTAPAPPPSACNAKGPALTWSERAGPNSGAIRNAAPLACLNARDERMVDALTKPATSQPGPQRNPEGWLSIARMLGSDHPAPRHGH